MANIDKNTVSNKKFRELLRLSEVTDPEGGNFVSIYAMDGIGRHELLATYDRQKDEIVEVELASLHEEINFNITDYQMDVLFDFIIGKSDEFAKQDANYMTSYEYAMSNGWGYGN